MNTPDNEAAIYAQAFAMAQLHRLITHLGKEGEQIWNECQSLRQQLDTERNQHGKTREEAQKLMEHNALLQSRMTGHSALQTRNAELELSNEALRKERDELKAIYAQAFADLQAAASNYDKLLHERNEAIGQREDLRTQIDNERLVFNAQILALESKLREVQP